MNKNRTFALFGGSFDPPHLGHTAIADAVLELPEIDSIVITPAYRNPLKQRYSAPAQKRLRWCKRVFNKPEFIVSDFEVRQQRAVYTIETLNALEKHYNIQAIVIGADNLRSLQQWHRFSELNKRLKWIITTRNHQPIESSFLRDFKVVELDIDVSSTEIRSGKKLEFVDNTIKTQVVKEYNLPDFNM